jgi:hypothetical protein
MRKRTLLGKGASLNTCSKTLVRNAMYSSISSATIATSIITSFLFKNCHKSQDLALRPFKNILELDQRNSKEGEYSQKGKNKEVRQFNSQNG